ncbi:MAG: hypothetical protein L3J93_00730 [Thermoplasmata archaeon]|nr:hypothetical protein [Thermoplasmata archaeon]
MWNGSGLLNQAVAEPLLLLPIVAVATDLAFQFVRFPRVRFPDAAIANGLFLSVILWPSQISLALVSIAIVTVGLRHAARWASHPLVNPAAAGIVLAAAVFALPQPWHVGSTLRDTALVGALGLIAWAKAPHTWRLWAPYFATNLIAVAAIADFLGGSRALSLVVNTALLGTTPVFYGLFMVTEPRTAPSPRPAMIGYAVTVGLAAAAFPALFAEVSVVSALGVLAPYLALFVGNLFTLILPAARGAGKPAATRAPTPPLRLPARAATKP